MTERFLHRESDGELIGMLRPTDEGLVEPCCPFGAPLAPPMPQEEAEEYVHRYGLESLMDLWIFSEDGEQYSCSIVEARPGFARYQISDYGHAQAFTKRESNQPADELTWSRKGRA